MTDIIVHRCRLFEFTPCAIHNIAVSSDSSDIAISRSNGNIEIWSIIPNCFPKMVISAISGCSIEALIWVGNRLISGGINGDITEYDLASGSVKLSVDSFGGAVWCLCSNQNQLVAGCEDGSVKLFNLQDKSISYERAFDKQEGRILSIAWHVDGNIIVTGGADVIRLWSVSTGRAVQKIIVERLMKKIETIVWSVLILSDCTVISGDSYGRVQFWNGNNGTLLKSHHVHRADVLSLCLGSDERSVYAGGVDPKVMEFKLLTPDNPTTWVAGRIIQRHTHDVRAIAVKRKRIFSGGVAGNLMAKSLLPKSKKIFKSISFPVKSHVSISVQSKLLLLQYEHHLDMWKIAECDPPQSLKTGLRIPIEKHPIKMVTIKKSSADLNVISCSRISRCGRWLVYSTAATTRLYRIHREDDDVIIKVSRIHCSGSLPSHDLIFTPDSHHLIMSTTNHSLLFFALDQVNNKAELTQTILLKNTSSVNHVLAASSDSKLVACGYLDGEIDVFDVISKAHVCSLPCYQQTPTSISFIPQCDQIMVVYDDMQVLEFDLKKNSYTPWTKQYLSSHDQPFLLQLRPRGVNPFLPVVTNTFHKITNSKHTLYFAATDGIYIVEKGRISSTSESRFCNKFSPLLYADLLEDDSLFVVERPLQDLYDQLPPTLYQKKFGL